MRGQGLNAHLFVLTSGSQQDYCPTVAWIRSRRPSAIMAAIVHQWRPGRHSRSLGLPSAAYRPRHQGPQPRRPARRPAPTGAWCFRSAPPPRQGAPRRTESALRRQCCRSPARTDAGPRCRLAPASAGPRRARHHRPQPHSTTRAPTEWQAPLTACPGTKSQWWNCLASTAAR